jgi:glycosyltransferase involved in cell wall biosynthesis
MKTSISAFIVCSNEERQIARALNSVKFCDEIVVIVDDKSKDKTEEIARAFGAKVIINPWPGFVKQKAFGLKHCSSEWVLNIDADEELSPELQQEIQQVCNGAPTHDGFEINRVVYYLGRWWRRGGWYPEFRLRLVRRSAATWGGDDPHEHAIVSGSTARLDSELYHYTHTEIADQIDTLNRFSSQAARTQHQKKKRVSLTKLIGRPIARFIKFYILKRGYRDGIAGLVVAVSEAFYVFLKYAKLWELNSGLKK